MDAVLSIPGIFLALRACGHIGHCRNRDNAQPGARSSSPAAAMTFPPAAGEDSHGQAIALSVRQFIDAPASRAGHALARALTQKLFRLSPAANALAARRRCRAGSSLNTNLPLNSFLPL